MSQVVLHYYPLMWYCGMMWYVSSRASIGCCVSVSAEVATTLFIVIIITIINIVSVNKMDTKSALISVIQFIVNHGLGVAYHISYINIYIYQTIVHHYISFTKWQLKTILVVDSLTHIN